jgi:hypothetical protein
MERTASSELKFFEKLTSPENAAYTPLHPTAAIAPTNSSNSTNQHQQQHQPTSATATTNSNSNSNNPPH